jgi:hypothetical protein
MENTNPWLLYLLGSAGATVSGLLYWMAIENLANVKGRYVLTFFLSLFLTPVGAWVVSLVVKARQLTKEFKKIEKPAA